MGRREKGLGRENGFILEKILETFPDENIWDIIPLWKFILEIFSDENIEDIPRWKY